jgi:hypothetical protein
MSPNLTNVEKQEFLGKLITPSLFGRREHDAFYNSYIFVFIFFAKATRGLEPISFGGALLSTLLHVIVYGFFTQFAECTGTECE